MWLRTRKKFMILSSLGLTLCIFLFYHGDHDHEHTNSHSSGSNLPQKSKLFNKDIHVVIGYYQGNELPWIKSGNVSEELINSNMYKPDPEAGKDGAAVLIPSFESPKSSKLFQINRFNLMASDKIPLNRSLPDVRRKTCQAKTYSSNLPRTSIIIVFHNEAWSTLMRTLVSIETRSGENLVEEIILVDDASQREFLKRELEEAVAKLTIETRIIRSKDRIGLIRARLLGAKEARGEVLTFLDAHCEVSKGWLPPLLQRILEKNNTIASPVIDIINDDTFQYVRSFELHQGAFNWELHFRWFSLPSDIVEKRIGDEPFETPVIAGGLFSISRKFFYHLGAYDEEMQVWGGENLEISLRAWLCGGVLEIVPCSHVGHLFRKSSPYSFPGGVGHTLNANLARVALVWIDKEWRNFIFKLHPEIAAESSNQSIASRLEIKERLQCKNFEYYLQKIYPTNFFPQRGKFFGKLRHHGTCLQTPSTKTFGQPYGPPTTSPCIKELYAPQLFIYDHDDSLGEGRVGEGAFIKTDDNVCLDGVELERGVVQVRIMACSFIPRQRWERVKYHADYYYVKHVRSGKCLGVEQGGSVSLTECPASSWGIIATNQGKLLWQFENVDWM